MGRELDSLADVISFGVAPAVIAYACGMQGLYDRDHPRVRFVACGVSRLARYNVTAEALSPGTGQGEILRGATRSRPRSCWPEYSRLPRGKMQSGQTSGLAQLSIAGYTLHPLALLFVLSGSLMISRIRIPKL